VSENRGLRRIFGCKRDEETGEWRKLYIEEANDLYCAPNIIRMIRLTRMRWEGHVTRIGERRGVYRVLVEKLEGKRPLGRPECSWRIILRWNFRNWDWKHGLHCCGSG
jgi:hypothetical protein